MWTSGTRLLGRQATMIGGGQAEPLQSDQGAKILSPGPNHLERIGLPVTHHQHGGIQIPETRSQHACVLASWRVGGDQNDGVARLEHKVRSMS